MLYIVEYVMNYWNVGLALVYIHVYGHITVKTPDLVRSPKISTVEPE
jgi:hypothetical protein